MGKNLRSRIRKKSKRKSKRKSHIRKSKSRQSRRSRRKNSRQRRRRSSRRKFRIYPEVIAGAREEDVSEMGEKKKKWAEEAAFAARVRSRRRARKKKMRREAETSQAHKSGDKKAKTETRQAHKSGDKKAKTDTSQAHKSGDKKAKRVLTKDELDARNAQRGREHELKLKKLEIAEDRRKDREANRKPKKSFSEHYRTAHSNIESTFGHQKSPLEKTKKLANGWVNAMEIFLEGFGALGSILGGLFKNILDADLGTGSSKEDRQTKIENYHTRLLERRKIAEEKRKEIEQNKRDKEEEEEKYQRDQQEKKDEREHELKKLKLGGRVSDSYF